MRRIQNWQFHLLIFGGFASSFTTYVPLSCLGLTLPPRFLADVETVLLFIYLFLFFIYIFPYVSGQKFPKNDFYAKRNHANFDCDLREIATFLWNGKLGEIMKYARWEISQNLLMYFAKFRGMPTLERRKHKKAHT